MCGIVGIIDTHRSLKSLRLETMSKAISYRGPDSSGVWINTDRSVGFGHRRLSILDLSPAGHQPMHSRSGRYTITFNGEVFNYRQLASELSMGPDVHNDTAVMLECFERYGISSSVEKFVGMFAFAVWDAERREVTFVRDRLGIKPLHYGWHAGQLVFCSDLAAVRALPDYKLSINLNAANLFMRYGYVPAPWCIESGFRKLSPGCLLNIGVDRLSTHLPNGLDAVKESRYWSIEQISHAGLHRPFDGDVLSELASLLEQSVKLRMISDVPLGAFLSGGVDSSLIVALMQKHSDRPVQSFSIGFSGEGKGAEQFDESPYARLVAKHLGTNHTELQVTSKLALQVVPSLPNISDEPFGDLSIIPTYLVCKLARKEVTVALSGDGGDELFGGYNRYQLINSLSKFQGATPYLIRRLISVLAQFIPSGAAGSLQKILSASGCFPYQLDNPGEKLKRIARLFETRNGFELYTEALRHWQDSDGVILGADPSVDIPFPSPLADLRLGMALSDKLFYLPDDILTKVDRASMACSLEARVPLLDHRVVEFAARLPTSVLYRDGRGKWPLRELLKSYLPVDLIDRPKRGFSIPIDSWLRDELRDWANEALSPSALEKSGVINPSPVLKIWQQHLSGTRNCGQLLWNVLMFQSWYCNAA